MNPFINRQINSPVWNLVGLCVDEFPTTWHHKCKYNLHVWDETKHVYICRSVSVCGGSTQRSTKAHGQSADGMPKKGRAVSWACSVRIVCVYLCVCVCKKANMFSGGSVNRPRAAQRGLSSNDPPQPAVPSPFYVNHFCTEKPLECTGLSHVAQQRNTLASAGTVHWQPVKLLVRNSLNLDRLSSSAPLVSICWSIYSAAATQASIWEQTNRQSSQGHLWPPALQIKGRLLPNSWTNFKSVPICRSPQLHWSFLEISAQPGHKTKPIIILFKQEIIRVWSELGTAD